MSSPVKKRHVFYLCGYDWKSWQYYATLFRRELDRHCAVTGAKAALGEPETAQDGVSVSWHVQVSRPDGASVETIYEFLLWDHVIDDFRRKTLPTNLLLMAVAFLDTVITGTLFKITNLSWRFALFWFYPIAMMCGFMAFSGVAGVGVFDVVVGLDVAAWVPLAAGVGAAVAVFYGLLEVVERRNGLVLMLLGGLIFNVFHVRRRVSKMNARIEQWVARVTETLNDPVLDEVLIIGHSWGTMHAVEVAGLLAERPELVGSVHPPISVMTIGSTTPAIARHPAAGWLRGHIRNLARSPHILWVEYQARKDLINFPGVDIVGGAGVDLPAEERHATCVHQVRFRDLLNPDFYRTIRNNLFRLHFQFLMANDIPGQAYDFFDIVTGPETLWWRNGLKAPGKMAQVH